MSAIFYKNLPYGAGGSNVEANPSGSSTDDLEKIGIDGTVYDVTDADAVHSADRGVANGVASLDATGRVPSTQLPSYVDDVLEYASQSAFPATGESGKIYIALDTNKTYRWSGSAYVEISESLALGTTHSTAAYGDDAVSTAEPSFSEASTRTNLAGSGEKLSVILGKIKKWFTDLKDLAFIGKDGNNSKKYLRGDGTWQSIFEGSVVGDIQIKDNDSEFTTTIYAVNDSLTGLNLINVPDKSGTMAVTSDIVAAKNDLTAIAEKTDTDPYIYRPSVANGDRVHEDIVGASVGWNQILNLTGLSYYTSNGITLTVDSGNGTIKISGTATSTAYFNFNFTLIKDHVYLVSNGLGANDSRFNFYNDSAGVNSDYKAYNIGKCTNSTKSFYLRIPSGSNFSTAVTIKPILSDLTVCFSSTTIADYVYSLEQATAGSGIAWLKSYGFFTKSYYPYNAGELLSVEVSGKKYVGKNLINLANSEQGGIDGTGALVAGGNMWRGTEFIKVVPNKKVTFSALSGYVDSFRIYYYDQNKNYIGRELDTYTYTIPSDCAYIKWVIYHVAPYTFTQALVNSINLQLEYGENPTTYEPYHLTIYTFTSQTLRGLFTLVDGELKAVGDVYREDGTLERKHGIITLTGASSETWYKSSVANNGYYYGMYGIMKTGGVAVPSSHFVYSSDSEDYRTKDWYMFTDSAICISLPSSVADSVNALKTWLASNPLTVVYELVTPTTEQAEPLVMPQICDKNGTEEFVTTSIVPVGHESTYYNYPDYMESGEYKDFRDRVDYAPEKAKWKKVGEYNTDGQDIVINGYYNEIMIVPFMGSSSRTAMNGVTYPFELFGTCDLAFLWDYLEGSYQTDASILKNKKLNGNHKIMVYVR